MNKLKNSMQHEAGRLTSLIQDTEHQLTTMPDGLLKCYSVGNRHKLYVVTLQEVVEKTPSGKSRKKQVRQRRYLKQSELQLAEQLAIKGLIQAELQDAQRELKAINRYLKYCSSFDSVDKYLNTNPDICNLVDEYKTNKYLEATHQVSEWLAQRSGISAGHEERLTVKTHAGFNVRSKSERDILHALIDFGLPYKYEEQVITDIGPLFPDFTILNPLNGKEVIWEHNGSMDDPIYAAKVFKRTAAYYRAGYHPGKNFIITYEENNEGLDRDWIDAIIIQHFTNPYLDNRPNIQTK